MGNLQEDMDKEELMTMVEEAVKDVLADQEVVEYIRELIAKRLIMIMEEEALQRTVEGLVDKVVGDLRLIMAKQVQSVMEEKLNVALIGTGDAVIDDKKLVASKEEERKNVRKDKENIKQAGKNLINDNEEVSMCRKGIKQSPLDVDKIDKKQPISVNSELALSDRDELKSEQDSLIGDKLSAKSSEKKKALEDLRKLMNMMEEVVQGAMGGNFFDDEVICGVKDYMHNEEELGRSKSKSFSKMECKRSSESLANKYTPNKKTLKNKKTVDSMDDGEELDAMVGKKSKVRDEPVNEPLRLDSDEDTSEEGTVDMKEMLRLKKILSAMNKYVVGDVK